ncbi:MAG: pectate lyase [Paludibacteraceae bacterium]|nr:pectate lyase [Paludibacteraceae bacterium]
MNNRLICALLACCSFAFLSCKGSSGASQEPQQPESAEQIAFPEAQGCGMTATGGRGGQIVYVTSLEDNASLPGTFRYAVNMTGPRIIIFRVAGNIRLTSPLRIKKGNVSILGQSAPGDGICISGYPTYIEADNVIVRFIRFRMGDEHAVEGDALTCIGQDRIMLDHCSFSWSTDECASCYGNTNFTMQYCFITESLRVSVHGKGTHGYGGIWGGTNATFHHNLLAHHDSRNPRFDHDYVSVERGPVDYVNNVVYNWGGNNTYGGESGNNAGAYRTYNMVNNYYKPGPASRHTNRIVNPTTKCSYCAERGTVNGGHFYISGNYLFGNSGVTADNWSGVEPDESSKKAGLKAAVPYAMSVEMTNVETAEAAFETVLAKAGASYARDQIDARIADEVRRGTTTYTGIKGGTKGIIDSQTDVGGWPDYAFTSLPDDVDRDGIPDSWEQAHGLDPNDYIDGTKRTLDSRFTNLEVYLNSLVSDLY